VVTIRPDVATDFPAIDTVVRDAFGSPVEVDPAVEGNVVYPPALHLVAHRSDAEG
jgi:hypothetical protein